MKIKTKILSWTSIFLLKCMKKKTLHCDWLMKGGFLAQNCMPCKWNYIALAIEPGANNYVLFCFHFAKTESHSKVSVACKCHRNCSKRANFHVMNVFHKFVWDFTSLERQKRLLWALQSTRKIVGDYIYEKWRSAFLIELIFYLQMTKFPNEWYAIPIDYEIIPWKISCEKLISYKYGFFVWNLPWNSRVSK